MVSMVNEYNILYWTHIAATVASVQRTRIVVQAAVHLDVVKRAFAFVLNLRANSYIVTYIVIYCYIRTSNVTNVNCTLLNASASIDQSQFAFSA